MNTTHKSTAMEELAANALETHFENFDDATIEHAKNRIIDTLGCSISGAKAPGNSELVDLIKDWGGKEEATVLVYGGKIPAHNAAMVNSIMARSFDFEPSGVLVGGANIPPRIAGAHISGTTVMTAITMGEFLGINGKELITAMLVGDDIASRLIMAGPFRMPMENTGLVNVFGAAATAGRLLGLNSLQMRNALGIALNHLSGSFQSCWEGTTDFKLLPGLSARDGIFSAQLAEREWTGPEDAFLGKFGYQSLYTESFDTEILTKDLGKKYHSDVHLKPYPCCGLAHGAIDCALTLVNKTDINADDIREVIAHTSREGIEGLPGKPFRLGGSYANAVFSYQYNVACALLRRNIRPEYLSEEAIRDTQINSLISKIKLVELTGGGPMSARLEVIMNDGRKFSEYTEFPRGDYIRNPMTKDEVIAKFLVNIEFSKTVTKKNAEKLLQLLDKLEQLDSVSRIIELSVV